MSLLFYNYLGNPRKLENLFEVAHRHEQEFNRNGRIDDLNNAIADYEVHLKDLRPTDRMKQYYLRLGRLYKRRFELGNQVRDLDKAISNYDAGKETSQDSFNTLIPAKSNSYLELASLYEQRFVREDRISDLDSAITVTKAGIEQTPRRRYLYYRTPGLLHFKFARLYEQRFDWGGRSVDIRNAAASQEAGLKLSPYHDHDRLCHLGELTRIRARFKEVAKELLLEDLQQIANCIRRPKADVDVVEFMLNAIKILEENDADRLCNDIRDHSIRLGTYCEALRSQMDEGTGGDRLITLYDEIVATEREISAAYKNLTAKYERMYKLWRGKREQISSMLSILDSVNLQNYTNDIQTRIQRVDEGFETIRKTIDDQKRTLNDYFKACKARITLTNSKQGHPSGPVPPDNPELEDGIVGPALCCPSEVPKTIQAGKETLSEVSEDVGRTRYTKAKKVIEDKLSTTASQLEKLHHDSRQYELNAQELLVSQSTCHRWWSRWRGPSHEVANLIKSMANQLTGIQRGFDKYKHSILGLIFRPLGDMIEDLKPYFSQVGQEIIMKGLHPDMILYEAAFFFLIKSHSTLPRPSLLEPIDV